jgi:hypothetical protein
MKNGCVPLTDLDEVKFEGQHGSQKRNSSVGLVI